MLEIGDVDHVDITTGPRPDNPGSFLPDEEVTLFPGDGVVEPPAVVYRRAARTRCSGDQPADLGRVRREPPRKPLPTSYMIIPVSQAKTKARPSRT